MISSLMFGASFLEQVKAMPVSEISYMELVKTFEYLEDVKRMFLILVRSPSSRRILGAPRNLRFRLNIVSLDPTFLYNWSATF